VTDAQLLAKFVTDRSPDAFTTLVTRHAGWVHSLARRTVRDPHLAHDVAQAVFVLLAERASTIRDGSRLAAWLLRATDFAAKHAVRDESRRRHREQLAAAARPESQSQADPAKDDPSVELYAALDQAVARLNRLDRDVITRRFYQGQSLDAVGEALGISADAARKRVARSLNRLRRRLAHVNPSIDLPVLLAPLAALPHSASPEATRSLANGALHLAAVTPRSNAIAKGAFQMMIRAKLKPVAAIAMVFLIVGGVVLAECVNGGSDTIAPANSSHSATPSETSQSRTVISKGVMIAISPDGKQLIGYARQSGTIGRIDGDAFSLDRIIVADSVGVYHAPQGAYYGFSARTGAWDKLALSADVGVSPVVFEDMVTVEAKGHLYAFALGSGKWSTIY